MTMELEDINRICNKLNIEGEVIGVSIMSSGHINSTFKIDVLQDKKLKSYIVQKINTYVFKKPDELMQNILNVTEFIGNNSNNSKQMSTLKFLKGENGKGYVELQDGFFRAYEFVPNSETYDITENLDIIYETGFAFGEFQKKLQGFDSGKLFETIPDFHNTPNRFVWLEQAVNEDAAGRRKEVEDVIKEYLDLRAPAEEMYYQYLRGDLPARVTHNDTKCNNVLFNTLTKKHICVIDLDTVMPGLVGYDFGDGVRSITNSSTEDERDLSKVNINLDKFKSYTKGFLDGAGDALTKHEIETLPLGAITMTVECGARFLTDYLNGDKYFKIGYPKHNLDRARCQLALAQDMIRKSSQMQEIVDSCSKNAKQKENGEN